METRKRNPRRDKFLLGITLSLITLLAQPVKAQQAARLGKDVEYQVSANAVVSNGDNAPFWFTNNKQGVASIKENNGYIRVGIRRQAEADSLRKWRIGYGMDIVAPFNYDQKFIVQQLYADVQYKALRLSIGQKERACELKNMSLTTGGLTTSINARPIPQIRLELPNFWTIPRTGGWLALKAHIAYGVYTDGHWQADFNALSTTPNKNIYSKNSLYHSKAGFVRVGNTDKFPVTITGGLEMASQFGGKVWNIKDRPGAETNYVGKDFTNPQKLSHGPKDFWHAFIPGGNDVNDGDFNNAAGNQLGSWHLRLDYEQKGWGASVYMEHFFEDHSQMFLQYAWKDMMYGVELKAPKNPILTNFVYEHLRTTDQSGPVYHDGTSLLGTSIYGIDNYYNHHIYGAWQHAGYAIGNPLLVSPIYNKNGDLTFYDNRILANHFGIGGHPIRDLSWRAMYTYEKSYGTYYKPRANTANGRYLMLEATYKPHQIEGLCFTAAYGQNNGTLLGKSKGGMLTIAYSGWINKKHK